MGGDTAEARGTAIMRALVVYESIFDNTAAIAEHVATGLARWMDVDLAKVSDAPTCIGDHVGLLVVGGPTHPSGPNRRTPRKAAVPAPRGPGSADHHGLHEWLNSIHKGLGLVHAAAFDTRTENPNTPASAARTVEEILRSNGFHLTEPTHTFHLEHPAGPLQPAEAQRAQHWAEHLAAKLATHSRPPR
ncbi:flavodoxin family protein [Saccharopolyspora phatthalungensis]|uniref:Flavodoxin n=1 Tax=Saccharopolyspora phatthalungensis TaxID=664693 RepID=A0A840QHT0_9PSEU|nr:flavodoxin [Saccharopolyspora phatthalungensis]MBB5158219.1 hypothetical protein [Saccharopolyspora phatthalungensis]